MSPSQYKSLLFALEVFYPNDDHMIVFDVDKSEHPLLPSSVAFQIPISIRNTTIHWCNIDEGTSTYVMATSVWKQLGSPDLFPATITLCAWEGHASQPLGLYNKCPIIVVGKTISIDIKVFDSPLD